MVDNYYRNVVVETYRAIGEASRHEIRVRPLPGQGYPADMHVECSRPMRERHPVGTKFKIQATLKSKEDGPEFLYSHYNWDYEVLNDKEAKRIIRGSGK